MTRRSFRSALCAALATPLVLASMLLHAGPAGAHEGDAIIEVDQEHPGATSTHYFVRVTWEDDDHPVVDGTVTATAVSPGGAEQTPVALNIYDADEGLYEGTVEMPEEGAWTVRFTSVDPPGSIEHTQEVAATSPTTPETERDRDQAVDDDAAVGDEDAVEIEAAPASDDDSGPSILVLALVFLLLATAAAGIFWLMTRRRQTDAREPAGDEASGEPEEAAATADSGSAAGGDAGGGDSGTP